MSDTIKITNLNDDIIDTYFKLQSGIFECFGYIENWKVIPMEDSRECVWLLNEEAGFVRFAVDMEDFESGDYYENEIYTQRFLTKYVYRTDNFTMICVDTHTDDNKYLQIFDNKKEIKVTYEKRNN